jgi:hypothetical protein
MIGNIKKNSDRKRMLDPHTVYIIISWRKSVRADAADFETSRGHALSTKCYRVGKTV